MALTLVQEVRLTIGLIGNAYDLLSDDEITHYLTKNNNNIRRTCLDCGKTVLFILAQLTHTKADVLEEWSHDWFNNYYKTLQMYMNDQTLVSLSMVQCLMLVELVYRILDLT